MAAQWPHSSQAPGQAWGFGCSPSGHWSLVGRGGPCLAASLCRYVTTACCRHGCLSFYPASRRVFALPLQSFSLPLQPQRNYVPGGLCQPNQHKHRPVVCSSSTQRPRIIRHASNDRATISAIPSNRPHENISILQSLVHGLSTIVCSLLHAPSACSSLESEENLGTTCSPNSSLRLARSCRHPQERFFPRAIKYVAQRPLLGRCFRRCFTSYIYLALHCPLIFCATTFGSF